MSNRSRATHTEPPLTDLPILPHPNLLFTTDELEALKAKRKDPQAEALFQEAVYQCDQWMDPRNEDHPDWETLKDPRWRKREGLLLAIGPLETCAFVFAVTGDRKYADFAKGIVFAIIRHKLADQQYDRERKEFHVVEKYPGWRHSATHDFGNLSYALAIFYDLCGHLLTEGEHKEFVAYAEENLRIALEMSAEIGRMGLNNRGARCAMGNAMLALAVHEKADRELVRYNIHKGMHLGGAWATYSLGIDGESFEGASYCITTSVMLTIFGRACARRGLRDLSRHPHLARLPDFLIYNLAPTHDGFLPVNDCFTDLPPTGALAVSNTHRNGVYRWLYDELQENLVFRSRNKLTRPQLDFLFHDSSIQPVHPKDAGYPLAKHFRDHGVVSMLSSWESDAAHLLFFCGAQVYGGHRQDDQNSFTFCALGEKFAWDGGYDDFAGVYEDRAYRRTEFHNTILIDGQGQIGYDKHYWPRGHIVEFRHNEQWNYVLGDASRCYGIDGVIARADRHIFFRRGPFPYAVIVDDVIVDDADHAIAWNFVAHPHTKLKRVGEGEYVVEAEKASLGVRLLASSPLSFREDMGGAMPRLQATQHATRARFATLLLPQRPELHDARFEAVFKDEMAHATITLNDRMESVGFDLRDRSGISAGDHHTQLFVSI